MQELNSKKRSRVMALTMSARTACIVLLGCAFLMSPATGGAQSPGKMKSAKTPPKEDKIPENLSPEKVDSYLAGISDQQARRLLAVELKKKAAAKSGDKSREQVGERETGLFLGFFGVLRGLSAVSDQVSEIIGRAGTSWKTDVREKLFGGRGFGQFIKSIALLLLIILLAWAAEWLVLRKAERLRKRLIDEIPRSRWAKPGMFLEELILNIFGFGLYVLVSFLACVIIFGLRQPDYLVSNAIIVTYYFVLIEMAARLLISPKNPELRLIHVADSDARFLYNWMICITASVIPGAVLALALQKSGASREVFLLVYSTAGPIMSILLAIMIWQVRHRVARMICPPGSTEPVRGGSLREACAHYWHYPAILFVIAAGGCWWVRVLTHADATILRLIVSLFLIPISIGVDQWLQQILTRLGEKRHEIINLSPPDEAEGAKAGAMAGSPDSLGRKAAGDISIYFPLMRKGFRTVISVFLFFAALELWGVEFEIGWVFAEGVLSIVLALLLGLIVWEVVKARIDRKIEEEMPFQDEDAEEGGSGGSRSGTLLMLLRKSIKVFLLVVFGFSILAAFGVNIAPLLAGAGVIGLAIGFGSQTLVRDIISGVFFLIDDAFRVGDYVEVGTAKGTVEAISLRSLRLRHPRGQVFVVPFGTLKMVRNFTRDYIIEKLDIRVRFDTDPDVVRKIIKKISKEVMEHEEFANVLLSPIKSVGIRAMDDSAMIIRVKFKCLPREEFVLRREVFYRIQRAFKEKGIEFAQRNVTVYLPSQSAMTGTAPPEIVSVPLEAAGAAAAAAIARIEEIEAEEKARSEAKKKPE